YLVDYCQTDANSGWPKFLISVPTAGRRYASCITVPDDHPQVSPHGTGKMQLDIAAEVGAQLVRAYEMTGNKRWFEAAQHWGDLLARNRNRESGKAPWGRYADNTSSG